MKSLRELSLNLPEEVYHADPAWSYSKIARYAKEGFKAVATIHDKIESTPSMEFGSIVDTFITRPEDFDKEYVVDESTVSPAEKAVFDKLLEKFNVPYEALSTADILNAAQECNYYPKYKDDTKLARLADASHYYDVRRTGRKPISQQDFEDAYQMADAIYHHKTLKEYFHHKDTEDIEYIYQAQFKIPYHWTEGTVTLKMMADLLVVNHKNKTIQPIDLKTSSSPAYDFKENFIKFRYDIQAAVYSDILNTICAKVEDYNDYTVLPFIFAVVSRSDMRPIAFEYNPYSESQADGLSYTVNGKEYKNKYYRKIFEELLKYEYEDAHVPDDINEDDINNLESLLNASI